MKIKAICTHCGRKQVSIEKDHTLECIPCRLCGKIGCLIEVKN